MATAGEGRTTLRTWLSVLAVILGLDPLCNGAVTFLDVVLGVNPYPPGYAFTAMVCHGLVQTTQGGALLGAGILLARGRPAWRYLVWVSLACGLVILGWTLLPQPLGAVVPLLSWLTRSVGEAILLSVCLLWCARSEILWPSPRTCGAPGPVPYASWAAVTFLTLGLWFGVLNLLLGHAGYEGFDLSQVDAEYRIIIWCSLFLHLPISSVVMPVSHLVAWLAMLRGRSWGPLVAGIGGGIFVLITLVMNLTWFLAFPSPGPFRTNLLLFMFGSVLQSSWPGVVAIVLWLTLRRRAPVPPLPGPSPVATAMAGGLLLVIGICGTIAMSVLLVSSLLGDGMELLQLGEYGAFERLILAFFLAGHLSLVIGATLLRCGNRAGLRVAGMGTLVAFLGSLGILGAYQPTAHALIFAVPYGLLFGLLQVREVQEVLFPEDESMRPSKPRMLGGLALAVAVVGAWILWPVALTGGRTGGTGLTGAGLALAMLCAYILWFAVLLRAGALLRAPPQLEPVRLKALRRTSALTAIMFLGLIIIATSDGYYGGMTIAIPYLAGVLPALFLALRLRPQHR